MYKYIIAGCFFILVHTATAQLSVKLFNYRPTGDLGFVFKPTFSAEVGYTGFFEDGNRWRKQATITFIVLKPRLETFPTTGVLSDGTGTHILPGEMSYQKYNIAQIFAGVDYALIMKNSFFVYAGLDITAGGTFVEYTDNVPRVKTESYSGGGLLAGFRFRLGAEYMMNDRITLMVSAQRCGWIVTDPQSTNAANDYGLGIRYNFQ